MIKEQENTMVQETTTMGGKTATQGRQTTREPQTMQVFSHPAFGDVRTLTIDGKRWFVGRDIAAALGYRNMQKALRDHVDDEDRMYRLCATRGGNQETVVINEAGLYSLIMSSKLSTAKEFKRWITTSACKASTNISEMLEKALLDPDIMISLCQQIKAERSKRLDAERSNRLDAERSKRLDAEANVAKMGCDSELITVSKIAEEYGETPQWLNRQLEAAGVQYKRGGFWQLKKKYIGKGYTGTKLSTGATSKTSSRKKAPMYWTPKGRLFIHETLKAAGVLPLAELLIEQLIEQQEESQ